MREMDKIHKPLANMSKEDKSKAKKQFQQRLAKLVGKQLEVRGIL